MLREHILLVTGFACTLLLLGCQSEEERLEGLVDACLGREGELKENLATCEEDLSAAHSALTGEGRQEPVPPPPLMPMRARVSSRPGEPGELEFRARSYAGKKITAFRFRARMFNAFDEVIPCDHERNSGPSTCPTGAEELSDMETISIEPRRSERVERLLADFPRATKAIVTIYEVTLEDGEVWRGSAVGYPAPPPRARSASADGGVAPSLRGTTLSTPELLPLPSFGPLPGFGQPSPSE